MPLQRREFLAATALASLPALDAKEEPVKRPIKVGQIGVGHAHASKLAVYRKSADYEVVGVVEPDAELRKRAESQEAFRDVKWLSQAELLKTAGLFSTSPGVTQVRLEDDRSVAEDNSSPIRLREGENASHIFISRGCARRDRA